MKKSGVRARVSKAEEVRRMADIAGHAIAEERARGQRNAARREREGYTKGLATGLAEARIEHHEIVAKSEDDAARRAQVDLIKAVAKSIAPDDPGILPPEMVLNAIKRMLPNLFLRSMRNVSTLSRPTEAWKDALLDAATQLRDDVVEAIKANVITSDEFIKALTPPPAPPAPGTKVHKILERGADGYIRKYETEIVP